ncbi:efflux RND transporter periplasmic adaptor subunit [Vibrio fluvialis]|uniref:efflux RND transporter periplasmic adaptor subunit n=1 Tax=Vibrio fluvialis TaxID=676 RepID=UPI0023AFB997|nr:efflux RND transporter periplasmic adaptor subunit [Vibrio fluvialis]
MKQWQTYLMTSLVLLAGCGHPDSSPRDMTPKVKVTSLGESIKDSLYFPAVANAAERSHLSFRVNGEIRKINVKEGDRVKAGDVIAELDPTDYQLNVDNAQARYSVIDSQYRRSSPLVEKGLLAKSQFDEIAAQRQIAMAELELAKLRLSFTQLKAPVEGIISRVNVDQFENVQVGQQVVNIHSLDNIEVLIQLPDRYHATQPTTKELSKIRALVRVPSGNEYEAQVKEFTTEPDPSTGTFTVTLTLPMPENELILDGMAVEVTAKQGVEHLNPTGTAVVPVEAVFNGDGDELNRTQKFVWVLNADNSVSKHLVRLGNASKTQVQIVEGITAEDSVVVAGLSRLRDGMTVSVVKEMAHE